MSTRRFVIAILLSATIIRFYGIGHDLPYVYDGDENLFVRTALTMLKNHDLNPHWFGAPAATTICLLGMLYMCIFIIGWLIGTYHGPEAFSKLFYTDPTLFFLTGRIANVLFGVASVWVVYAIGRRLFNSRVGLVAATVLALSPIHILLSQNVRMDVQMTFFLLVTFWYCLNILDDSDLWNYLLAGLFAGLAIVTKYPAVVIVLIIMIAHFSVSRFRDISSHLKLMGSGIACLVAALVVSPFLFLNFSRVLADVKVETRTEHLGHTGAGFIRNFWWYLHEPLPNAISFAGIVLLGVGIVFCLTSRKKGQWLLIAFNLLFLIFISSLSLRWERWILPVIPFACLLLGNAIDRLAQRRLILFVLLIGVLLPIARASVLQGRGLTEPYTSTLAREWIMEHLPAGSHILLESSYGPQLPPERFKLFVVESDGELNSVQDSVAAFRPFGSIGNLKDFGQLRRRGVEYFVLSSSYERHVAEKEKYPSEVAMYEQVMSGGQLLYGIEGSRGPKVRIYKFIQ